MYGWLCRRLPRWIAGALLVLWYSGLLLLVLRYWWIVPGEFRYGAL